MEEEKPGRTYNGPEFRRPINNVEEEGKTR